MKRDERLIAEEFTDEDMSWSHVGPLHERAYFNLVPLVGYAPSQYGKDTAPFKIYNTYGWTGNQMPNNCHATIPAAKRAGRKWINQWISECEGQPMTWQSHDTGVHFNGFVHGMQVIHYYYCPEPIGTWHKDFKVWFGCSFFRAKFANPEEAKETAFETWKTWLSTAQDKLLRNHH